MATLQDLTKQYRKSAAEAIYPGLPYSKYKPRTAFSKRKLERGKESRAFETGNLLTKFISSPQNNIQKIGSKVGDGYQIVVNVAPDGADYGRWVHWGTRRMDSRPFAQLGAEEPKFVQKLDEFTSTENEKFIEGELENIDDIYNKAGWKIS